MGLAIIGMPSMHASMPPKGLPAGEGAGSAPGGGVACDALLATALASRKLYSSAMSAAMLAVGSPPAMPAVGNPPASRLGMAVEVEEEGPIGGGKEEEEAVEEEAVVEEVVEVEEEGPIGGACPITCIRPATLAVSRSRAAEICIS